MRATVVSFFLVLAASSVHADTELVLRVVDETGVETPARIELIDAEGRAHVARDGLLVRRECFVAPLPEWLAPLQESREIDNPYTGTTQFYADGTAHLSLPPGSYKLRAYKGPEYRRTEQAVEIGDGGPQEVTVELERWADPAARGWYGVDDHLHITRNRPEQNDWIARWMRAEGLHVANLLEMGTQVQLSVTPQYSFGDGGAYRDGELLLLAGQEHPRTHFLGHTITLGTTQRVDNRDTYIVYESTFAEGQRVGGVSGFAHWGIGNARSGLAISAPTGRVRFMEVLQFEVPYYDVWYQMLNLGVRIAPSAGTDFPCGPPGLPGRERFYVHVDGPMDRAAFVAAVRAGRTFTSNGPLIELRVNGAGPGDDVDLDKPGSVSIRGRVHFDPEQDRIDLVELVMNGRVIETESKPSAPGEILLSAEIPVERSAWFALRSSGGKLGEDGPLPERIPQWALDLFSNVANGAGGPEMSDFRDNMVERVSAAHTAAIFVGVAGASPAAPTAKLAQEWLDRLSELEDRLSEDRIAEIPIWDWIPYSDGVSEQHLRHNRDALLQAIAQARPFYERQIPEGD
ncbi:MAG: CehA/McbA family metallohydrolase [Proteobacteria bacterium]|nr:CehA/McbA family metallohydrolase [Pseudomonadota bacterium]